MKKFLAIIMLLIICLSFFSCTNAITQNDLENDKNNEEVVYEDMYGEEYVILQHQPVEDPFGYKSNTLLSDYALERLKTTSENYNCKITLKSEEYGNGFSTVIAANAATVSNFCDIIFANNCSMLRLTAADGNLIPIDDVSDIINFKDHEKWGDVEAMEAMMCDGVLYGVIPQTWLNYMPFPFYTLVYNRDLVTSYFNKPDPHEYYENKTWSRDILVEYIKDCTDTQATQQIYGMSAAIQHFTRQAILSNGCQMLAVKDDGSISSGWSSPEAIEALQWVQDTVNNNKECFKLVGVPWDAKNHFIENIASFAMTRPQYIFDEISFEVKNFGLMPWPNGPSLEYGQWAGYYENTPSVAIPIFTKDVDYSAILIDEIFKPMEAYPDREAIKNYYSEQVFHNKLDVDILFEKRSGNCQYCYWPQGGDNMINAIGNLVLKTTPTENIEKNISLITEVIEKHIYPNYMALDNYR